MSIVSLRDYFAEHFERHIAIELTTFCFARELLSRMIVNADFEAMLAEAISAEPKAIFAAIWLIAYALSHAIELSHIATAANITPFVFFSKMASIPGTYLC